MCSRYAPVLTKRDFVQRYAAGEFGNASATWTDWRSFRDGAADGPLYHLRNGASPGGLTHYKVSKENALGLWAEKRTPQDWYCSTQIPPHVEQRLLIQGEVMATERGLNLYYSQVKKPMRVALAEHSVSRTGVAATLLLKHYLCPNSLDWLYVLLRRYPEHVVEFSTYSTRWGTLPNFNTITWEVRAY